MRGNLLIIVLSFLGIVFLNIFGIMYLSESYSRNGDNTNSFSSFPFHVSSQYLRTIPSSSTSELEENNLVIGILIRSHGGYKYSLVSLLWGIISQIHSNDVENNNKMNMNSRVIVVPTEETSTLELKLFLQEYFFSYLSNSKGKNKFIDLIIQQVTPNIYETYCCLLKDICTNDWRNSKLNEGWSEISLNRYCEVNSPLHYHLTDIALYSILNDCPTCRYLLVTNADNSYSPDFFSLAIKKIENDHLDIVLTDMVHRGKPMEVFPELGKMDLGCALINLEFLRQSQLSFVKSLPSPTEPQHWHDADYWLIQRMLDNGAKVGIIRNTLFIYN